MMRPPRQLALALTALLLVGCGGTAADRPAELETENRDRREQLEDATSTPPPPALSVPSSVTTPSITAGLPTTSSSTTTSTTTPITVAPAAEVSVLSVTDGDTLRVLIEGRNEPLRLIGINAPEADECLAAAAATRLGELMVGGPIRLESDVSERDQYGRLLRYVFVGELFVNEALVREGLALAHRYAPDIARAPELEAAQAAAEADQAGMWAPDACGAAATGGIRIGHIRYDADGDDNFNLNDEWVEFVNPGPGGIDLTGWGVRDESAGHRYSFPVGFSLGAGATVRLHTGCGGDTATSLYWCNQGSAIWNNGGDTVFVLDPHGNIAVSETYPGG